MFPEIRERVAKALSREGRGPITLDLKSAGDFSASDLGWYARNGFPGIWSTLASGGPSWSGESVNVDKALNHSVVWACKKIISESVGFIPAIMMQAKGGNNEEATWHPMYNALKHAPNAEITAQSFTETDTGHCLMAGNSYAQILRRTGKGTAMGFHSLTPEQITPDREKVGQKRLVYILKEGNAQETTYTVEAGKPQDILHIRGMGWDGIKGYSVITMARQSVGTAIAAEKNVAAFYRRGGRLPYVLTMDGRFKSDEEFQKFRIDWNKTYGDPEQNPILQAPVKDYKQIGISAADAQLLETRQFGIHEICRWFGVSPHLVGDLAHATFANVENLALQFVNFTLATWLTRWEEELWRCVLTDDEKAAGYFWRHDTWALLRGDFKARMEGYASALQNAHMSVDEVRGREGLNALPNGAGKASHIQLNMATLPGTGEPMPVERRLAAKPAAQPAA